MARPEAGSPQKTGAAGETGLPGEEEVPDPAAGAFARAGRAPEAFAPSGGSPGALRCALCHHRCRIPPGSRGLCGVRENRAGGSAGDRISAEGLSLPYYGYLTALADDPIEKKPLYHFRPGSRILSLGFAGCNLRCPFCQNWHSSQIREGEVRGRRMRIDEVIAPALEAGQIAYTYSEPLIHLEFLKDCMEYAHEQGLANVLVSNGCIETGALEAVLPLVDAANIDLKCFSERTYREVLGGDLETVLDGIRAIRRRGICLELTTLVVPGLNDSEAELDRCAEYIAALGAEPVEDGKGADPPGSGGPAGRPIPWHLSAYHPSYRWDALPTDRAALLRLAARARNILPYVYTGNIAGEENDTPCPRCGAVLIRRRAYRVDTGGLAPPSGTPEGGAGNPPAPGPRPCRCAACGAAVPVYR